MHRFLLHYLVLPKCSMFQSPLLILGVGRSPPFPRFLRLCWTFNTITYWFSKRYVCVNVLKSYTIMFYYWSLFSGEEHWTKVLQANEVNSCCLPSYNGATCHPPLTSQLSTPLPCNPADHHSHTTCPCGRPVSQSSSRHSTSSSHSSTDRHSVSSRRDSNILSHLFTKVARWVGSNRRLGHDPSVQTHLHNDLSRGSSTNSFQHNDQQLFQSWLHSTDTSHQRFKGQHMSVSSEDSDLGSVSVVSAGSTVPGCNSTSSTSSSVIDTHEAHSQSSFHEDIVHSNHTLTPSIGHGDHRQWHQLMPVSHGSSYTNDQWATVPLIQRSNVKPLFASTLR